MTPKQKQYLQWLLAPINERKPKTEEELASVLRCQAATLKRWCLLPEFQEALDEEIQYRLVSQKWAIYQVLAQKALEGDFRSIRMFLEFTGDYPVPQDSAQQGEDLPEIRFTLEDYARAAKRVREWEQMEFGHIDPAEWM
jgi:hypothetical protein